MLKEVCLIVILLSILSCQKKDSDIRFTQSLQLKLDSLENFQQVEDLKINEQRNCLYSFVQGRIDLRNENYYESTKNFDEARDCFLFLHTTDINYQNYQYYFYYNKFKSKDYNTKDILNLCLEITRARKASLTEYQIRLLFVLSSILRDLGEMQFSFACSGLGINLLGLIKDNDLLKAQIYFNHAVNLTREGLDQDSLYFNLASSYCRELKNPMCKYYNLLAHDSNGIDSLYKFDSISFKSISDSSYYFPRYTNAINVQLNWMLKDVDESKKFKTVNNTFSRNHFYQQLYDIDDLILENKFSEAHIIISNLKKLFEKYKDSKDLKYLVLNRQLKFHLAKYKKNKDENDLMLALKMAEESFNIRLNSNDRKTGLHVADFVFDNFIYELFCLSELIKVNPTKKFELRTLWILQKGKIYQRNLYAHQNNIINKLDEKARERYISMLKETHKIEATLDDYKTNDFSNNQKLQKAYNNRVNIFKVESAFPEVLNIADTLSLDYVQTFLRQNKAQIIDYTFDDSVVYISHISSQNVSLTRNIVSPEIVRKLLNIDIGKKLELESLKEISNLLIPNSLITDSFNNILIIPDGPINRIPIDILTTKKGTLVDNFNISYLSNISSILDFGKKREVDKIRDRVKVFSFSSEKSLKSKEVREIPELRIGLKEARTVMEIYQKRNPEIIFFHKAKLDNFFGKEISHFSTHSYSSTHSIFDNFFYTRTLSGDPYKVYGIDLLGLNINCKNIVLSSCDSGVGIYKNGSGVFSLSRNFIDAGAESITKSLWKVNEKSTSILMTDYHKNLVKGHTASMALTLAKRKLKQNPKYSHPYYWAGFVLEGNPNVRLDLSESK